MKKTIKELYNDIRALQKKYEIELNIFRENEFEDGFSATISDLLNNEDWSFMDKISLEDYNSILNGYEEEYEAEYQYKSLYMYWSDKV